MAKCDARALWGPECVVFLEKLPGVSIDSLRHCDIERVKDDVRDTVVQVTTLIRLGELQTVFAKINKLVKIVFFLQPCPESPRTPAVFCRDLIRTMSVGLWHHGIAVKCTNATFQFGTSVVEKHIL